MKLLVLVCILVACNTASGQARDSLVWEQRNGERVAFALTDVLKITFDSLPNPLRVATNKKPSLLVTPPSPNPFRSEVSTEFYLDEPCIVQIRVCDFKGTKIYYIRTEGNAGLNKFKWNAHTTQGKIPSGLYILSVECKNAVVSKNIYRVE